MKKGKYTIILPGLVFVFALVFFLMHYGAIFAEEVRLVRISARGVPVEEITIEPQVANIAKGTVVHWANMSQEEVQVIFEEGKRCSEVTAEPARFKLDFQGCYLTDYIRKYEFSQLKFPEEGAFDYVVRTAGGVKEKGKIIVK